jgi:hypothetical protein
MLIARCIQRVFVNGICKEMREKVAEGQRRDSQRGTSHFVPFTRHYCGDQIKAGEMGWTHEVMGTKYRILRKRTPGRSRCRWEILLEHIFKEQHVDLNQLTRNVVQWRAVWTQ